MKIALLTLNSFVYESSFSALAALLISRGHDVTAFYQSEGPPPRNPGVKYRHCAWWIFDVAALTDYAPDRVLVFNGSFVWCAAATAAIKSKWKTLYAELGWLPQANHIYVDSVGPGARSQLFQSQVPAFASDDSGAIRDQLAPFYTPTPISIEGGYLFVPLQLEADTSILWDSPYFKTMQSLVGFLRHAFPEQRILVKTHPLGPQDFHFDGAEICRDKIPIHNFFPGATAVAGINSTALIEAALMFKKPVMALGLNVACGKGVFYEGEEAFHNPQGLLNFSPDGAKIDACLQHLHGLQFPAEAPPIRVAELIER